MNNNERLVDDNSTVSIQDNEKLKQVERKEYKKEEEWHYDSRINNYWSFSGDYDCIRPFRLWYYPVGPR